MSLQEQNRQLTVKIKTVSDEEVPLLKAAIEQHNAHIDELTASVAEHKRRLVESETRNMELARKLDSQSALVKSANDEVSEARRLYAGAVKERDEAVARLAKLEQDYTNTRRQQEDVDLKLQHAMKVKQAVEEQFQAELRHLHSNNTELKVQLQTTDRQKQDLQRRVDSLSRQLAELQSGIDERMRDGLSTHGELQKAKQEAEMLLIERNTLESELIEKQSIIKRLELEMSRLKRDETIGKRNEQLEHLQAKIESLTALNAYLKEQVDQRDRQLQEMQERVKQQEDSVRHAFAEVDQQSKKLKKRELLINQALKRLEAINTIKATPLKQQQGNAEDEEF